MRVRGILERDHWLNGRYAGLDPLPPDRHRVVDGFEDATDLLGPGVYILEREGEVVYVGWAKAVLERIAKHRELVAADMPSWFPVKGVVFDRFHFRRCASDIGETLVAELTARYLSRSNEPSHADPA